MMDGSLLWRPGESVEPLRSVLSRGGVVAFPTESSYGYGVDPRNPVGVNTVYRLKGRPGDKALPVVVASVEDLECLGIDPRLKVLEPLGRVWPAAITAVLPTSMDVPAAAGTGSLAVRIPAHEGLRQLLREVGPLTATSANPTGSMPALTVTDLLPYLEGQDALIVESSPLPGGLPSTLIRWDGLRWEVLREGAYPVSALDQLSRSPDRAG